MSEPLVLLPGLMCDARLFAPQIAALSGGRTLHLANLTRGDTIAEMATHVLADAPARFALAGHYLGGMVAMEILRQAPDRVSRLCVMDTSCLSETPAIAASREPRLIRARSGRLADALREDLGPDQLAAGPSRMDVLAKFMAMAMDLGPQVYERQIKAIQRRPDQQPTLRKLRNLPVLIVCGAEDSLSPPRRHEFMSALIPGAKLALIERAGHLPTLEQPEAVSHVLADWLGWPEPVRRVPGGLATRPAAPPPPRSPR
ncbi:alpha/beta hydrolase [Brevirhabdus pacifica]|uniref:Alpha/beta hydrolase n=2 Tax=Brevirhabdus pacifica TaxID=1267768 RepID=A0A1U7DGC6_9RHOB|nr:alpha/beta fold hydrolase [Brevirhabdus pacifica]APX88928.1 alpha/beta hydrolase [Brevirhabdus pacifica]PJJ86521.1 pimeloyl-ACP methyl ester carboxylesterase [Brevirhabdus pacifica]